MLVPLLNETIKEQTMKFKGITIHKTKNCNTWYTRFRKNGKQNYISAKTQKECYNKLKLAYKDIEHTKLEESEQTSYSLKQWYEEWLKLYKINKVEDNTIRTYKVSFKHLTAIENKNIELIKLNELIEIIDQCKKSRQKQNVYELLKMLYDKAEDNEIIEKNLMKRIDKPKHIKNHGLALTNEQQTKIIEIYQKITNSEFFVFSMYQGLRPGEVLGLTWDNINFTDNTLTINKAWKCNKNEFTHTKNSHSKRTMPLFENSKRILETLNKSNERVFNITNKQKQLIMQKIKKVSNISDITSKDMRSTFMTRCDELGVPERVYQAWVGHRQGSRVTREVYVKHNADIDNKYINILNDTKFYSNSTHEQK